MVALIATIHDFLGGAKSCGWQKKTWMVGLKPTMTALFGAGKSATLSAPCGARS